MPSLLLLLVMGGLAALTSAIADPSRLHPQGWYAERFRAWAQRHNVSLPSEQAEGRRFRQRLAVWAENKCVRRVLVLGVG